MGLAAAALAAWATQHLQAAWWPAASGGERVGVPLLLALLACLAVGGGAWIRLDTPPLPLGWDGQQWQAAGAPCEVELMLQTERFVLLRLAPPSGVPGMSRPWGPDERAGAPVARARWLGVGRAEAGPAWHGLRVALHAPRAAAAVSPDGQGR